MEKFLRDYNIDIHFTSSLNHNGNSDVESLHNAINEYLRILKHTKGNVPIEEQIILINSYYNESIHSTTNKKPIDSEKEETKVGKFEGRKDDIIIEDRTNYIKETRGGKNYLKF